MRELAVSLSIRSLYCFRAETWEGTELRGNSCGAGPEGVIVGTGLSAQQGLFCPQHNPKTESLNFNRVHANVLMITTQDYGYPSKRYTLISFLDLSITLQEIEGKSNSHGKLVFLPV